MPSSMKRPSVKAALLFLLSGTALILWHRPAVAAEAAEQLGARLPIWSIIPFVGILLSIAMFPLFAPSWWHKHFPRVSAFWGLLVAVPFVVAFGGLAIHEILHTYLLEYFPFIILLWVLFTAAGGIHIKGSLLATPERNVVILLIGTAIASWIGTTGASMILIRVVLRANAWRTHKVHVIVFFIFLVSNIGGSLTPLGDPPLFLGFLLGVPFFWTMRLLPDMLFMSIPILVLFYVIDKFYFTRDKDQPEVEVQPIRVEGWHNLFILVGVVGAVLMSGVWRSGHVTVFGIHMSIANITRDVILIALGLVSLVTTRKQLRVDNGFTWFPIKEVGYLFAGIFMTIIPAILMLKAGEEGPLGALMRFLESPAQYFWITGALSSFLDNAPSYLTIVNSCLGDFFTGVPVRESIHMLIDQQEIYLKAISVGAVFWGALTYIGNAPNFMVKSIAEEAGIKMPSFFGFMFRYSLPVLIPLFVLLTLVFF